MTSQSGTWLAILFRGFFVHPMTTLSFLFIFLVLSCPPAAAAATPCCGIKAIDQQTGIVTAVVNQTGETFQFKVTDPKLLRSLKVGQGVYANFASKQVSVDGISPCCGIVSVSNGPSGIAQLGNKQHPASPGCGITGIGQKTGLITAKENGQGREFVFKVTDARLLNSLRVGQGVYANFASKQVSVDGITPCCGIVSGPTAVSAPTAAAPPGKTPMPPANTESSGKTAGTLLPKGTGQAYQLPTVNFGPPQQPTPLLQETWRLGQGANRNVTRDLQANINGRVLSTKLMHLSGLDGIERSHGLPEGAKNPLLRHVRKINAGESDHYIVNVQLAEQWIQAHPELAQVSAPPVNNNTHTGCTSFSWHCAEEAAAHAEQEISKQAAQLRQEAQAEWTHVTGELNHELNMAGGCFEDHTISALGVPVNFSVNPQYPIDLGSASGSTKIAGGTASGKVSGTLTIGLPMKMTNSAMNLELYYIPCLPFVVRPKAIGGSGTFAVAAKFTAELNADGNFESHFTVPPKGGPHFPVYVIPIIIGDVPVAEFDVSVYIDGSLALDGEGSLKSTAVLEVPYEVGFSFSCAGETCGAPALHSFPVPITTTEAAKVDARVHIKPAIYTALQLDFDVNALSARAGPQPYLYGELAGCGFGTATQSTSAPTGTQDNFALAGDLDWGVELRAEALIGGQQVGKSFVEKIYPPNKSSAGHLWFQDLIQSGSTALAADLEGVARATVGKLAGFTIRSHQCYLYTDSLTYQITWTGSANPVPANGCTWQAGKGTCSVDPKNVLTFSLNWTNPGQYMVTATPLHDQHGRKFSETPRQVTVNVQTGSGGSPAN